MKTVRAAVLATAFFYAVPSCPASEWDYRPLAPNHAAAFLWFLHPTHQPASTLDRGAWEFASFFHYSSHYVGTDAPPWQLFQHVETASLFLAGRWGVAERFTLDAEISFHSLHQNRLRGLLHHQQMKGHRYWLLYEGATVFDGGSGLAAGDATLGVTALLARGGGTMPRLTFRAAAQLPTGSESRGFGNGKTDYAATLAARWRSERHPRKGMEIRAFGAEPGGLSRAPHFPSRFYGGGAIAFHAPMFRPFSERWTAGGTVFWNTSPVDESVAIRALRGRSLGIALALFREISPRAQMEFTFMEDVVGAAPAVQDFAFAIGMRFRSAQP